MSASQAYGFSVPAVKGFVVTTSPVGQKPSHVDKLCHHFIIQIMFTQGKIWLGFQTKKTSKLETEDRWFHQKMIRSGQVFFAKKKQESKGGNPQLGCLTNESSWVH